MHKADEAHTNKISMPDNIFVRRPIHQIPTNKKTKSKYIFEAIT